MLSRTGEGVTIEAKAQSLLLILSGESIDEPVASYGPFVMNTEVEIQPSRHSRITGRQDGPRVVSPCTGAAVSVERGNTNLCILAQEGCEPGQPPTE